MNKIIWIGILCSSVCLSMCDANPTDPQPFDHQPFELTRLGDHRFDFMPQDTWVGEQPDSIDDDLSLFDYESIGSETIDGDLVYSFVFSGEDSLTICHPLTEECTSADLAEKDMFMYRYEFNSSSGVFFAGGRIVIYRIPASPRSMLSCSLVFSLEVEVTAFGSGVPILFSLLGGLCRHGCDPDLNDTESCNGDLYISNEPQGTCQPDGTCACRQGLYLSPLTGRCHNSETNLAPWCHFVLY